MESRIRHASYVINFLDMGFSSDDISKILKSEVDKVLKEIRVDSLSDWEIQFRATYTNAKQILISRNKLGSYPSDKYKEITIAIPIPLKDIVSWGVDRDKHIYSENHYDKLLKNFNFLPANFKHFQNRTDYIMDCMRRAIKFCFEEGFTVGGVKVKSK